MDSRPVTAVVGAGPAGLLFCFLARLGGSASNRESDEWPIYLFDKRTTYERTHRLRLDKSVFEEIRDRVSSEEFDTFVDFLAEHGFAPEINEVEAQLRARVERLGIHRETLTVGPGPGEYDLADIRSLLESDGRLEAGAPLTIIGADSVHSAVRDLARGSEETAIDIYQVVARLQVSGPSIPSDLGRIETYRLAKVLGSVIDYRINANGYGEVDLFLDPAEHARVEAAAPSPKAPISVDFTTFPDAPLFSAIVSNFQAGFGDGACEVTLISTFRLESQYQPSVVFASESSRTTVLLLGDAAISLPFFRGVAALARCSLELVDAHIGWLGDSNGDGRDADRWFTRYQERVSDIRAQELSVVASRERLVRGLREFARLSAMLPFPIQQWFLSKEAPRRGGRLNQGALLNLIAALAAAIIAVGAPIAGGVIWPPLGWLFLAALPIQMIGGALFVAARSTGSGENPLLATIWRFQLFIVAAIGIPVTLMSSLFHGRVAQIFGAVGWLILGAAFTFGLAIYERSQRRLIAKGRLDR